MGIADIRGHNCAETPRPAQTIRKSKHTLSQVEDEYTEHFLLGSVVQHGIQEKTLVHFQFYEKKYYLYTIFLFGSKSGGGAVMRIIDLHTALYRQLS
jgi:hypothetical protein